MGKIKVYLDNCSYNRLFDDQKQLRISLETQAKHTPKRFKPLKLS
jgi:hypothetical protein